MDFFIFMIGELFVIIFKFIIFFYFIKFCEIDKVFLFEVFKNGVEVVDKYGYLFVLFKVWMRILLDYRSDEFNFVYLSGIYLGEEFR